MSSTGYEKKRCKKISRDISAVTKKHVLVCGVDHNFFFMLRLLNHANGGRCSKIVPPSSFLKTGSKLSAKFKMLTATPTTQPSKSLKS